MTKIKMVVFDMAGTTVNENNVVYKTLHKAINEHGTKVSLETVLENGAGKEKLQAIKDVLTSLNGDAKTDAHPIFQTFKMMLEDAYKHLNVTPIDGVENQMLQLRANGVKVVLNTGYNSVVANNLLEKLRWNKEEHYDLLITADDVVNGRPHPDMIEMAMKTFDITDSAEVLKAGDSAIDIEEGKNANCGITVGVLSGAQTKEQLENASPDYIIDSLATIDKIIVG
ncbi:phosphonatase-like hydrolase [Mangrovimonas aestuarii]|uniref:phosphonatase-like hydrolase n=1 Tax=Mangrovimonas aestuarii TaxID=3018443 RepID=UPI0023790315|nr:phosphonatase-like hydrolase [Mangrovimonas aestuarii]